MRWTVNGSKSVVSFVDDKDKVISVYQPAHDGESEVVWGGQTFDGGKAPAGQYHVKITTPDGKTDTGSAYVQGTVSGLRFTADGLLLQVGGQEVPLEKVVQFLDAVGTPAPAPTATAATQNTLTPQEFTPDVTQLAL